MREKRRPIAVILEKIGTFLVGYWASHSAKFGDSFSSLLNPSPIAAFRWQVTMVVVWKLDRLARSLKEGINVVADWCRRGVRRFRQPVPGSSAQPML
jgi:hypothetical protein